MTVPEWALKSKGATAQARLREFVGSEEKTCSGTKYYFAQMNVIADVWKSSAATRAKHGSFTKFKEAVWKSIRNSNSGPSLKFTVKAIDGKKIEVLRSTKGELWRKTVRTNPISVFLSHLVESFPGTKPKKADRPAKKVEAKPVKAVAKKPLVSSKSVSVKIEKSKKEVKAVKKL